MRAPPPRAGEYFGSLSSLYDGYYDAANADGHLLRARLAAVLRHTGDGPGEALDAGMGPGRLCEALAAKGWGVSGVDASVAMVEAARTRLGGTAGQLVEAPVEALPFADRSFDLVTATGVLEYADVPLALKEIARVLRPGGRAVVTYPNPRAIYGMWKTRAFYPLVRAAKRVLGRPNPEMPHGAGELPPAAFQRLVRESGLEPIGTEYVGYMPLITPLEMIAPRAVAALSARFERRGTGGRVLATQIVYAAHNIESVKSGEAT
jgi:ubiquinone/menaquinone biosynthesis C-methylase UbiE